MEYVGPHQAVAGGRSKGRARYGACASGRAKKQDAIKAHNKAVDDVRKEYAEIDKRRAQQRERDQQKQEQSGNGSFSSKAEETKAEEKKTGAPDVKASFNYHATMPYGPKITDLQAFIAPNTPRVQTHKLIQQATMAARKMAERNVWA